MSELQGPAENPWADVTINLTELYAAGLGLNEGAQDV